MPPASSREALSEGISEEMRAKVTTLRGFVESMFPGSDLSSRRAVLALLRLILSLFGSEKTQHDGSRNSANSSTNLRSLVACISGLDVALWHGATRLGGLCG